MEVTKVKIYPYNVKYGKLGKCQVILDHELLLTGLTLMDYYGKRYVIYPKNVNNKRELCFVQPIKKPLADKINKAVFEAYDKKKLKNLMSPLSWLELRTWLILFKAKLPCSMLVSISRILNRQMVQNL